MSLKVCIQLFTVALLYIQLVQGEEHNARFKRQNPLFGIIGAKCKGGVDRACCLGGDDCCKPDSDHQCGQNEGDCDTHADCQPGLLCGYDNCRNHGFGSILLGFDSTDDCCYQPCSGGDDCCTSTHKCGPFQGDCDSDSDCQSGLACGKDNCAGPDFGFDATDDCCYCNGGDECCTPETPCGDNQGDCDTNADCEAGLLCGKDNCRGDGFDDTDDCCYVP